MGLYCRVKRDAKIFGSAVVALALSAAAGRSASGTQDPRLYQTIPDKNVFHLKDPPPLTAPSKPVENPTVPKIILNGITTILGRKMALMKLMLPTKTPGDTGERSLMLREGERENDVEVLQINEKNGSVRVNDFGTVVTLTFDRDGAKSVAAAPASAPTPAGLTPTPSIPVPTPNPPPSFPAENSPKRKMLVPGVPALPTAPMQANGGGIAPVAGLIKPPANSVIFPPTSEPAPAGPLTAEEQKVLNDLEQSLSQRKTTGARAIVVPPAPQ